MLRSMFRECKVITRFIPNYGHITPKVNILQCKATYRTIHEGSDGSAYTPPNLSEIPRRWPVMKNMALQEEIKEYLDWKMQGPWQEMTREEKVASFYLAYGLWGPRAGVRKEANLGKDTEINITYFIFRVLFNVTLLGALGVSYINWKYDKEREKEMEDNQL